MPGKYGARRGIRGLLEGVEPGADSGCHAPAGVERPGTMTARAKLASWTE